MYSVDIYSIGVPYYLVFKKNRNNLKTRPGWAISKKLKYYLANFIQSLVMLYDFGLIYIGINGPILKNNLAILSHCSRVIVRE